MTRQPRSSTRLSTSLRYLSPTRVRATLDQHGRAQLAHTRVAWHPIAGKEGQVLELLKRNKERLLVFLVSFLSTREQQDENFRDEKSFLVEELQKL